LNEEERGKEGLVCGNGEEDEERDGGRAYGEENCSGALNVCNACCVCAPYVEGGRPPAEVAAKGVEVWGRA